MGERFGGNGRPLRRTDAQATPATRSVLALRETPPPAAAGLIWRTGSGPCRTNGLDQPSGEPDILELPVGQVHQLLVGDLLVGIQAFEPEGAQDGLGVSL